MWPAPPQPNHEQLPARQPSSRWQPCAALASVRRVLRREHPCAIPRPVSRLFAPILVRFRAAKRAIPRLEPRTCRRSRNTRQLPKTRLPASHRASRRMPSRHGRFRTPRAQAPPECSRTRLKRGLGRCRWSPASRFRQPFRPRQRQRRTLSGRQSGGRRQTSQSRHLGSRELAGRRPARWLRSNLWATARAEVDWQPARAAAKQRQTREARR